MLKRLITRYRLWRWERNYRHLIELAHVRQAQRFANTGTYSPNMTAVIAKLEAKREKILASG